MTNMPRPLKKVVFPVAGLGSRFLPATKAVAKEMLPVVDKPLIQYAVEEAVAAGFTEMIFVTGRTKRSIEDHFDKAYELEMELESRDKRDLLALARSSLPEGVSCAYVRQAEALGLGHAVSCAGPLVGDEPFAVILADDLIDASPGALAQMVDAYRTHQASVLCVEDVPRQRTASYGIVSTTRLDARNATTPCRAFWPVPACRKQKPANCQNKSPRLKLDAKRMTRIEEDIAQAQSPSP